MGQEILMRGRRCGSNWNFDNFVNLCKQNGGWIEGRKAMFYSIEDKQRFIKDCRESCCPHLPEEGFGSVYDQQDRIDLEERDK